MHDAALTLEIDCCYPLGILLQIGGSAAPRRGLSGRGDADFEFSAGREYLGRHENKQMPYSTHVLDDSACFYSI